MDHCGVIYGWEIVIDQVKLVQAKQSGPNGLNLHISKVLSDAAVTAWKESHKKQLEKVGLKSALTSQLEMFYYRIVWLEKTSEII